MKPLQVDNFKIGAIRGIGLEIGSEGGSGEQEPRPGRPHSERGPGGQGVRPSHPTGRGREDPARRGNRG